MRPTENWKSCPGRQPADPTLRSLKEPSQRGPCLTGRTQGIARPQRPRLRPAEPQASRLRRCHTKQRAGAAGTVRGAVRGAAGQEQLELVKSLPRPSLHRPPLEAHGICCSTGHPVSPPPLAPSSVQLVRPLRDFSKS